MNSCRVADICSPALHNFTDKPSQTLFYIMKNQYWLYTYFLIFWRNKIFDISWSIFGNYISYQLWNKLICYVASSPILQFLHSCRLYFKHTFHRTQVRSPIITGMMAVISEVKGLEVLLGDWDHTKFQNSASRHGESILLIGYYRKPFTEIFWKTYSWYGLINIFNIFWELNFTSIVK